MKIPKISDDSVRDLSMVKIWDINTCMRIYESMNYFRLNDLVEFEYCLFPSYLCDMDLHTLDTVPGGFVVLDPYDNSEYTIQFNYIKC